MTVDHRALLTTRIYKRYTTFIGPCSHEMSLSCYRQSALLHAAAATARCPVLGPPARCPDLPGCCHTVVAAQKTVFASGGGAPPCRLPHGRWQGLFGASPKVCAHPQVSNSCFFSLIPRHAATDPGRCDARRCSYARRTVDWRPQPNRPHVGRHRRRHRRHRRRRRRPSPPPAAPQREC